jgi:hypothetical protein
MNDIGRVVGQFGTATGGYSFFVSGPNGIGMTDINETFRYLDG